MPRTYDDEWVKKQLDAWPPDGYTLTIPEVVGFLGYGEDVCFAWPPAITTAFSGAGISSGMPPNESAPGVGESFPRCFLFVKKC